MTALLDLVDHSYRIICVVYDALVLFVERKLLTSKDIRVRSFTVGLEITGRSIIHKLDPHIRFCCLDVLKLGKKRSHGFCGIGKSVVLLFTERNGYCF